MMKYYLALIAGVIALRGPALARAQQSSPAVDSVRKAYERLNYETAARRARRILDHYQEYRPAQLSEVHVVLGAIRFAGGNQQAARQQFEHALTLQPEAELSTLRYSPKIVQLFQRVKEQVKQEADSGEADEPVETTVRYIIKEDARPQAVLRSAALPGAGQLYKGETAKGWTLAVLWGGALLGADLTDQIRQRAKRDYLDAGRGATSAPYDRYNRWYNAAEGFRLAAAAIWAYGVADALLNRQREQQPAASAQAMHWRLCATPSGRGPGLRLHVHF